MKTTPISYFALLAVLAGSPSLFATGQEELAAAIQQSRAETIQTHNELVANLKALDTLVNQKEGDLRPAYEEFRTGLAKTREALDRTEKRVAILKETGDKHFAAWKNDIEQIGSQDIRGRAMGRLDKAHKNWTEATSSLEEATKQFPALLGYLGDVDKALTYDLTPDGVKSVRTSARSAQDSFHRIQDFVRRAVADLEEMAVDMGSTVKTGALEQPSRSKSVSVVSKLGPLDDNSEVTLGEQATSLRRATRG